MVWTQGVSTLFPEGGPNFFYTPRYNIICLFLSVFSHVTSQYDRFREVPPKVCERLLAFWPQYLKVSWLSKVLNLPLYKSIMCPFFINSICILFSCFRSSNMSFCIKEWITQFYYPVLQVDTYSCEVKPKNYDLWWSYQDDNYWWIKDCGYANILYAFTWEEKKNTKQKTCVKMSRLMITQC